MRLSTPRVLVHLRHLLLGCCVFAAFALPALAVPPSSIHVQGVLNDNLGNPVNGSRQLLIRLYTQPTGGVPLASETHTVVVNEGLFEVQLDSALAEAEPYRDDEDCWWGVSVAGEAELLPRLRVGTVPYAHVSTGMDGDWTTSDGQWFKVTLDGDPLKEMVISTHSDTAMIKMLDSNTVTHASGRYLLRPGIPLRSSMVMDDDGDGTSDGEIEDEIVPGTSRVAIKQKGTGAINNRATTTATGDDVWITLEADLDGDINPEGDFSAVASPGTCSVAIKTKGTGADKNRISSTVYADSTVEVTTLYSAGGASSGIESKTKPKKATVEVKDLPSPGHTTLTRSSASGDTGSVVVSVETNGDSDPESDYSAVVMPGTCGVAIKTKGTGAEANRMSSTVYTDSAEHITTVFGPGGATSGIESKTKPKKATTTVSSLPSPGHTTLTRSSASGDTGSVVVSVETNGDSDPEGDYSAIVMPGTCSVAIKTRGTGADKNRVISTTTGDSALHVLTADVGGDEDPEGEGSLIVTPGTCSVAIKTKGTGADKNRVIGGTSPDSAHLEVASGDLHSVRMCVSPPGVGMMGRSSLTVQHDDGLAGSSSVEMFADLIDSYMNLKDDGVTTFRASSSSGMEISDNSGIVVAAMDRFGNARVSTSVSVGVASPTHPIEHSSGAHLTAGGTWTNASDVNLKENFENVNGAELLDKLSSLPITSWNYKNEGSSARHIGPTAQDFQKTFGVGSDGKSISTIDPSGIALAAIKELEGRNKELSQQNNLLQEKLEALLHRVEQLERTDRAK